MSQHGYTKEVVEILESKLAVQITSAYHSGETAERERIIKVMDEWLWDLSVETGSTYIDIWVPSFMEQVRTLVGADK